MTSDAGDYQDGRHQEHGCCYVPLHHQLALEECDSSETVVHSHIARNAVSLSASISSADQGCIDGRNPANTGAFGKIEQQNRYCRHNEQCLTAGAVPGVAIERRTLQQMFSPCLESLTKLKSRSWKT